MCVFVRNSVLGKSRHDSSWRSLEWKDEVRREVINLTSIKLAKKAWREIQKIRAHVAAELKQGSSNVWIKSKGDRRQKIVQVGTTSAKAFCALLPATQRCSDSQYCSTMLSPNAAPCCCLPRLSVLDNLFTKGWWTFGANNDLTWAGTLTFEKAHDPKFTNFHSHSQGYIKPSALKKEEEDETQERFPVFT